MKRHPLIWALAAGAVLLSIGGHAQQAQDKSTLEQRVANLERRLSEIESTSAGLESAVAENTDSLDAFLAYVKQQAKGATAMAKTLDTSESQGFTAGINFASRETLLAGWRDFLALAQKGIVEEKPVEKGPTNRGAQRSKR